MEEARHLADRGELEKGKKQVEQTLSDTTGMMAQLGLKETDDLMMAEVVTDLKTASTNMRTTATYQTVGAAQMMCATESHAFQRSNKVDSMMESGAEERSAYANHSKKMMMKSSKQAFGFS